jgi:hypothetical protein
MILIEYLNEGTLIKHYSDEGFLLLQNETGAKYSEPIDIVPCPYTYTETNEKDEEEDVDEELSDAEFREIVEEAL